MNKYLYIVEDQKPSNTEDSSQTTSSGIKEEANFQIED